MKKIKRYIMRIFFRLGFVKTDCDKCFFHDKCAGEYNLRIFKVYEYISLKFFCEKYEGDKK